MVAEFSEDKPQVRASVDEAGSDRVGSGSDELAQTNHEDETTPWHFKVMVIALIVYLLWRGFQLAEWAIQRLF